MTKVVTGGKGLCFEFQKLIIKCIGKFSATCCSLEPNFNSLHARDDHCCLLIVFANSLDPD